MTDFGVYLVFERGSSVLLFIHSFPSNRSRIIIIIVVVCKIYVIFASFIHRYLECLGLTIIKCNMAAMEQNHIAK